MLDRRQFLATGTAVLAAAARTKAPGGEAGLRTITYNVLACRGYPKSQENAVRLGKARSQMVDRFALELGLYEPDIVTFQESPKESVVAAIAERMKLRHAFFPGGFPGSVLTRFPILETENCPLVSGTRPRDLFTRHWGRAVLRTPRGDLSLYTAHLMPGRNPDIRAREVTEILKVMERDEKEGRSLIFQGDLNHDPEGPEYARWKEAGLVDAFAAKGKGPGLTIPSTERRWRIDYVLVRGFLQKRLRECRVLFEGAFRTNTEDSTSFALSDHVPVMATFA